MNFALRALLMISGLMIPLLAGPSPLRAQESEQPKEDAATLTGVDTGDGQEVVRAAAAFAETWQLGETIAYAMRGGSDGSELAEIQQGELKVSARNIVVFDTPSDEGHSIRVYAEDQVLFQRGGQWRHLASYAIQLKSLMPVGIESRYQSSGDTEAGPSDLIRRALRRLSPDNDAPVTTVGFQAGSDTFTPLQFNAAPETTTPLSRRIQIRPRSSERLQVQSTRSQDTIPEEQVYVITGGVNVLVEGLQMDVAGRTIRPGVLDLSADRVIIWTQPDGSAGLDQATTLVQSASTRFQVYLEGNIVVRMQQNTITASHAFFDANNDRALLLNAELRAFIPMTGGEFRVRAERLRQLSADRFHAQNGWTTTSPYGKPGYRLQASDIFVEPGPISPFTPLDPVTGQPRNGPPMWVTALNSQFIVGDTPLLWLPKVTAPAEDPNIPIRRVTVEQDRIFGVQVRTVWNLSKILGQSRQPGTELDLLTDYLSDRGPGIGIQSQYNRRNGLGDVTGKSSLYYQYDSGVDNLGRDRRSILPEDQSRGEIMWRHRQRLPGDASLFGEIGFLSDRNYLESFQERRFDTDKDMETLLGARQDLGLWSGTLLGQTELNEFEASTDWLPRADLFGFSQPILGGLAYWTSHSSAGYADMEPGYLPKTAGDPFTPAGLPYITDANGVVAMSRHEVDAPFMLGPVNINPFVMGEAAFWDEGLNNSDNIDRFVFSGGVQAHLAATKVMPFFRNDLWNLNGLAHKSNLFLEYRVTDSSQDLATIAQYNNIDDNAQERFRGRYAQQIYGGMIPAEFDPRFYAIRYGAGMWASTPYHELIDDQQVLRLRWRNRLQTKVGPAESPRIRDWMIAETGVTWFPDAARDNFGEEFGMIYGNYRWNISDRTSILSDTLMDLFNNSQDLWSIGLLSQRSLRGSVYLGFRQVRAKNFLDSQTVIASYSYQMSPKWISTASFAYDVAAAESRGSSVTFSRVGLDWLFHVGLGVDTSKGNVGVAIALEPRFGPPTATNLSYLLGLQR
ncbi:MAG: hypothetical protein KDA81_15160 [Planctomycetaceae bacterium]|nr:hypothetical protein [Planctomycetaceae bacterium]